MPDPLKNLALDKWYKVVLLLGALLLVLGFTQDTRVLTNKEVLLLAAGLISFGLAEWGCDSHRHYYKPPNIHTGPAALVTEPVRRTTPMSIVLHTLAGPFLVWLAVTRWVWSMTQEELLPRRNCDGCAMCCKLLSIEELDKPLVQWCPHCVKHQRCGIYERRPPSCAAFHCGYLFNAGLGDHWKPSKCKMVVSYEHDANRVAIHVDPGRGDAWRNEPFLSEIRQWATAAAEERGQVIVWQGANAIAVLPDRTKLLGEVRSDQLILTSQKTGPSGIELDVHVVDRDHPMAAAWMKQKGP
jgi:hypothetical protein